MVVSGGCEVCSEFEVDGCVMGVVLGFVCVKAVVVLTGTVVASVVEEISVPVVVVLVSEKESVRMLILRVPRLVETTDSYFILIVMESPFVQN